MADVLELARQRRAELVAELKKVDWFLEKAEALLQAHSQMPTPEAAIEVKPSPRPSVVAPREASATLPTAAPAEEPVLRVKAPEEGKAAQVYQRPVDTIVFKKMLSEMRRTHQPPEPQPVQEKIAAHG